MDLASLSDSELDRMVAEKTATAPSKSPDKMTDAELDQAIHAKQGTTPAEMTTGQATVIKGQEGATLGLRPIAAGIGAMGGNLYGQMITNVPFKGSDALDAFSEARHAAIQEQDKAQKDHPLVSTAANIAGSLLTAPLIAGGATIRGAATIGTAMGGASAIGSSESIPDAVVKVGTGALGGVAGYKAAKIVGSLADKAPGWFAKTASALTGVPDKEIETLATQAEKVSALLRESGGNLPLAANMQKENIQSAVKEVKNHLNSQISQALDGASKEANMDITPVIKKLEGSKAGLDRSLHPEHIKDIDDLISRIRGAAPAEDKSLYSYIAPNEKIAVDMQARPGGSSKTISSNPTTELMDNVPKKYTQRLKGYVNSAESVPVVDQPKLGDARFPEWTTKATRNANGDISVNWVQSTPEDHVMEIPRGGGPPRYLANAQTLQGIKQFLQDQASSAYGQSKVGFQIGTKAANAAKGAAAEARQILEEHGPKEIQNANRQLTQLHQIEDHLNKHMVTPNTSDAALMAVGSGVQNQNALALKELGDFAGKDFVGDANVLAAARTFNNPSWSPAYGTGKSLLPVAVGGSVGGLIGGLAHGPAGAAYGTALGTGLGGAMASPAMLKMAINTGRITGQMVESVASHLGISPSEVLTSAAGQQILTKLIQAPPAMSETIRAGVGKK